MTQISKRRFLSFLFAELAKAKPIVDAKVATLAGIGLEAEIWASSGIQPNNGWMIDSNPKVIQKLIQKEAEFVWRLYRGQAHSFPEVFRASYGEEAGLDLFHLDLYGTVEKSLFEVGNLIPIVAMSEARLFALTVSDQRGHHATTYSGSLWRFMNELFGEMTTRILRGVDHVHFSVIEAQRAMSDPYSSVRRECATVLSWFCAQFGDREDFQQPVKDIYPTLMRLAHKASKQKVMMYPVTKMQRVTYADGYRMKSYLFQLGSERVPFEEALRSLANAWMDSPFYFFDAEGEIRFFGVGSASAASRQRLEALLPILDSELGADLKALLDLHRT